jgi:hypothetical protein
MVTNKKTRTGCIQHGGVKNFLRFFNSYLRLTAPEADLTPKRSVNRNGGATLPELLSKNYKSK